MEQKVDADMKAAADVRDDMWGWVPTKERVLLVGVGGQKGDEKQGAYGLDASLLELAQLADTAGLQVVGTVTQRLWKPHPGTYVGKGKLAEIRNACGLPEAVDLSENKNDEEEDDDDDEEDGADQHEVVSTDSDFLWDEDLEVQTEEQQLVILEQEKAIEALRKELRENPVETVIFDAELSPRQARNLSKALDDKVAICDRTMLILDIFSQRARTAEGQLQVEMAALEYQLPRLKKMWTHLERQAGGAGGAGATKGMGETQIEIDKRLLRDRIVFLKKKLDKVSTHRTLYRAQRKTAPLPVISLVGYTNAGKSSLLNALVDVDVFDKKSVFAEDKLFATLDPTTRRVSLPDGKTVLATDTVGFIQRLPTKLVAAFRATLEEIKGTSCLSRIRPPCFTSNAGDCGGPITLTVPTDYHDCCPYILQYTSNYTPNKWTDTFRVTIKESSLLLHVVDVSSPLAEAQMNAVDSVLEELGVGTIPQLIVWNKIDGLPSSYDDDGWCESDDDDGSNGGGAKAFAFPGGELFDGDSRGVPDDDDDDCEWESDDEEGSGEDEELDGEVGTEGGDLGAASRGSREDDAIAAGDECASSSGSLTSKKSAATTLSDNVPAWIQRAATKRGAVAISARTGAGVFALQQKIQHMLALHTMVEVDLSLPYDVSGKILGEIHRVGVVDVETYLANGVAIKAHVPPATARRLREFRDGGSAAGPAVIVGKDESKPEWSDDDELELEQMLLEETTMAEKTS